MDDRAVVSLFGAARATPPKPASDPQPALVPEDVRALARARTRAAPLVRLNEPQIAPATARPAHLVGG